MKKITLALIPALVGVIFLQPVVAFSQGASLAIPSPRIIGGVTASISDAPWQAALIKRSDGSDFQGQFCGGSILSSRWVLTAAHCLDDGIAVENLMVLVGTKDLSASRLNGLQAKRYILHEEWDPTTSSNDVALIELMKPISMRAGVTEAIALPSARPVAEANALISGWGAISTNPILYPAILQRAQVQIVSDADCDAAYDGIFNDLMTCATGPDFSTDTCWGDSGGPLAVFVSGRWEIQGITSFGVGCAEAPYPGVYAEVYEYVDWIIQKLAIKPSIRALSPTSASAGTTVTISGSGFTGTNAVRVGTVQAEFTVVSDALLTFMVPESAISGRVNVANSFYEATYSKSFTVLPPAGSPEISRISTSSSSVGKTITITGKNLDTATAVTINGLAQTFTVRTSRELRVVIAAGTTSGVVIVTNPVGTVQSRSSLRIV